jgi:rubrerythrin
MEFNTSKTFQNIQSAIDGKTDTSTDYHIFSDQAHREGYIQIANIFDSFADQEQEHAEVLIRLVNNGELPDTKRNLSVSADEEEFFWTELYKSYAETAREEGFEDIARLFERIASADRQHSFVLGQLQKNLATNNTFCRNIQEIWICLKCGNVHWGSCAPEVCPLCGYPQGYYQIECSKY